MISFYKKVIFFLFAMIISNESHAAVLNITNDGYLAGASKVKVGSFYYDLSFVDGTCSEVFDGCDNLSDFAFNTSEDAILANQALLDQVFVEIFDTTPLLTVGVENYYPNGDFLSTRRASFFTPYTFDSIKVRGHTVNNSETEIYDTNNGSALFTRDFDLTSMTNGTWVDWQKTYAVPEPTSTALLLTGLAGLSAKRRRKAR